MASRARLETDGAPNDGTFAPYRSPIILPYRSQNFSTLAEVYNRQKELEQGLDEPTPADPPLPDPETTKRWAKLLDGRVYLMRQAASSNRQATFRTGPRTPGAATRLATLQKTGS